MTSKNRLALLASTASLCLAAGVVTAGDAEAATSWRTLKFTHGSNICLSLQSKASTKKGKRTQIRKCNGGAAQLWRIDRFKYHGKYLAKLHPGTATSTCLDAKKSEKLGSGWHLHAAKCSSSASQKWKYVLSNTGSYFTAQNYSTNLCVNAYKKGKKSGTWVGTAKCTSKAGQILLVA
ncbi:RICIN domain-containing protein [Streptomyces sp. cg35]|uniref:RICIN domain-containing protein n=1 Tax=Streptomyces sp. cg35 TaxID=3421650 RepID=UPI003D1770E8